MSFDNFLELIDAVPPEFCRNFLLIKKLDKSADDLMDKISKNLKDYKKSRSKSQRQEIREKTNLLFEKIFGYSDDKIAVALQIYEVIDRNIQKLTELGMVKRELTKDEEAAAGTSIKQELPTIGLDMPMDPNEPRYCLCNGISFGEMIACENKECLIEWFHLGCVNLVTAPKGEWYCAACTKNGYARKPRHRTRKAKRYY